LSGNIVYGSAKAGLDAFVRELTAPAKKVGVQVTLVRPGFVHSRMTEGLDAAPFATTPEEVASDMADGLTKGRAVVHSPAVLAPVGLVLKNLPGAVWRRISER
jgi:decaprenylphospho-beta-D-erythro-pentofuranosid-2-ulose 2-reductase